MTAWISTPRWTFKARVRPHKQGLVIEDVADVARKFKGQGLAWLIGWLEHKHGSATWTILEEYVL